ncbi:MAG: hypothetical protein OK439_00760 [Thaumarchaeota archaeon]|nr:hypothetical protein [Nitrososphaerota archaeon]
MIAKEILQSDQQVTIPKTLASRIRKIAPYGEYATLDRYVSTILDEFVSQLENVPPPRHMYNPFTDKELKVIKQQIQCFSLYA